MVSARTGILRRLVILSLKDWISLAPGMQIQPPPPPSCKGPWDADPASALLSSLCTWPGHHHFHILRGLGVSALPHVRSLLRAPWPQVEVCFVHLSPACHLSQDSLMPINGRTNAATSVCTADASQGLGGRRDKASKEDEALSFVF